MGKYETMIISIQKADKKFLEFCSNSYYHNIGYIYLPQYIYLIGFNIGSLTCSTAFAIVENKDEYPVLVSSEVQPLCYFDVYLWCYNSYL